MGCASSETAALDPIDDTRTTTHHSLLTAPRTTDHSHHGRGEAGEELHAAGDVVAEGREGVEVRVLGPRWCANAQVRERARGRVCYVFLTGRVSALPFRSPNWSCVHRAYVVPHWGAVRSPVSETVRGWTFVAGGSPCPGGSSQYSRQNAPLCAGRQAER